MAFLDETGLQTLWTKIKDTFALKNHSHTYSSLTSRPTTLAEYGITDAKINGGVITLGSNSITPITTANVSSIASSIVSSGGYAVDTNVVHKTGNEGVDGYKTFSQSMSCLHNIDAGGDISVGGAIYGSGGLYIWSGYTQLNQLTVSSAAEFYKSITVEPVLSSGTATVYIDNNFTTSAAHRLSFQTNTAGNAGIYDHTNSRWLLCCNSANNLSLGELAPGVTINGGGYFYTKAATLSKGETPSSNIYCGEFWANDANGTGLANRLGGYQVFVSSEGSICNEISTKQNIAGSTADGMRLRLWYNDNTSRALATLNRHPPTTDNEYCIPTIGWMASNGAAKTATSATSAGTITSTLPISKGGTGRTSFTNTNGVLTVAAATSLGAIATANGAFYATSANGVAKFGTLPVAQGGTGATTLASAGIITSAGAQTITGEKTYAAGELNFTATSAYLKKTLSVASNAFPTGANYLATRVMCSGGTTTMAGVSQWWTSDNTGISLSVFNPRNTTQYTVSLRQHSNASCYFEPTVEGILLGRNAAGYKWQQLIASTTTIATSDERYKSNIKAIPDNILDAWGGVQWRQYQLNDAIKEKGEGKARLHTGVIAQHVSGAFAEKGIDITRYGLFCHDEWPAEPEEKDDLGNVIAPAREASDDFAIRYEEALCMEAAYQRRKADRLEERVKKLEEAFASSQNTNQ